MENSAFISNVDKALAALIWNGIQSDAETKTLVNSEKQISFESPKNFQIEGSKKRLSIYLYNITEDTTVKNRPTVVDSSGRPCASQFFAFRYLITPSTGDAENDHLLLGKVIQILANSPMLANDNEGAGPQSKIRLDALSLPELNSLWTALDAPLKPCVSYNLSPVAIKCSKNILEKAAEVDYLPQTAINVNRTFELYQKVQKTFFEQYDGWKKRNMFQKQWIFQDFKKNTDMAAEEMASTINGLGDKLELHLATAQFIKPLTSLVKYYEHQSKQLKEFGKLSQKQRENVEMISEWIKDAKELLEELNTEAKNSQQNAPTPT